MFFFKEAFIYLFISVLSVTLLDSARLKSMWLLLLGEGGLCKIPNSFVRQPLEIKAVSHIGTRNHPDIF